MKGQFIRLLDIIVIGPTMMWAGWKLRKGSPGLGWGLIGMGVGTVVYNAKNYHDVDVARIAAGSQLMADPSIRPDIPHHDVTGPIRPELRDFDLLSIGDVSRPRQVVSKKEKPFQAIGEQPTPSMEYQPWGPGGYDGGGSSFY